MGSRKVERGRRPSNDQAQTTRNMLHDAGSYYKKQDEAPQPYTHAILDGGMAVLRHQANYAEMYRALAMDIVHFGGKISICERFPPVYGTWARPDVLPPPQLIMRMGRAYQANIDPLPKGPLTKQMREADARKGPVAANGQIDWTECIFAMDLDYGPYTDEYDFEEIVKDILVVQACMIATQADPSVTKCFVCIADTGNTLGVHLYFSYSCYYPEECFQLANYASYQLALQRPLHLRNGKNWFEIVDTSIYDRTLRMPGVQKVERCKACVPSSKSKSTDCTCTKGLIWKDRRYLPRAIVLPGGGLAEESWMRAFTRFIDPMRLPEKYRVAPAPVKKSQLKMHEISVSMNPEEEPVIDTEIKAAYWAEFMLKMASLRILTGTRNHTMFLTADDFPRAALPLTWIAFWDSVWDAALTAPETDASLVYRELPPSTQMVPSKKSEKVEEDQPKAESEGEEVEDDDHPRTRAREGDAQEEKNEKQEEEEEEPEFQPERKEDQQAQVVKTSNIQQAPLVKSIKPEAEGDLRIVLKIVTTPWSNPAGRDMSAMNVYAKQMKMADAFERRAQIARSKMGHLLSSTNDNLEDAKRMMTGRYAEFKSVDWVVTPGNDPYRQVEFLQRYIQMSTHPNYRMLIVTKISHSSDWGNTVVLVKGVGMHFCMIKGGPHRKNSIYFLILKNGCELTQRCHHPKCYGKNYNWFGIKVAAVRVLFSPLAEMTPVRAAALTEEQKQTARELIAASGGLANKAVPTKQQRAKITGAAPPPRKITDECDDALAAGPSPMHEVADLRPKEEVQDEDDLPQMSPKPPVPIVPLSPFSIDRKPAPEVDIDENGNIVPFTPPAAPKKKSIKKTASSSESKTKSASEGKTASKKSVSEGKTTSKKSVSESKTSSKKPASESKKSASEVKTASSKKSDSEEKATSSKKSVSEGKPTSSKKSEGNTAPKKTKTVITKPKTAKVIKTAPSKSKEAKESKERGTMEKFLTPKPIPLFIHKSFPPLPPAPPMALAGKRPDPPSSPSATPAKRPRISKGDGDQKSTKDEEEEVKPIPLFILPNPFK